MKKNYHTSNNPICPYTRDNCNLQDLDGYTNCKECINYGNGVRATGAMPCLEWIVTGINKLFKRK